MTRRSTPALIGVLAGIILGTAGVGALTIPVLQEHTAELQIMAIDMHHIRRDFDMGMTMADDVAPGQGISSGRSINPPSIRHRAKGRIP